MTLSIYKEGFDEDDYGTVASTLLANLEDEGFVTKEGTDIIGPTMVSSNNDYCVSIDYYGDALVVRIYNFAIHHEDMVTTYFLLVDDNWDVSSDGAVFYAWVWGGEYGEGDWVELEYDDQTHSFRLLYVPDGAVGFLVVRFNPDAEGIPGFTDDNTVIWNRTGDYYFAGSGNDIHISFGN